MAGGLCTHFVNLEACVSARDWEMYFQSIYAADAVQSCIGEQIYLPAWTQVSALEVRNLNLQLKSGQTPGTDNIPSEMLKDNLGS